MRSWFITAALAIATPASAQVVLTSGQGVAVTIDASGAAKVGPVRPAALGPHDLDALDQMRISYKTSDQKTGILPPVMMTAAPGTLPEIEPGKVQIVFVTIGDKDSVLVLLNGYDQGLTYRAKITVRGRTSPTDVCLVIPGRRGYEHWPYAIEKIELTELTLVDWEPADGVPCR